MTTLAQLESQIQKLQRRAEALRERKSAEIIASIRALMKQYGLSASDLDQRGATAKKRGRPAGSVNKAASSAVGPKLPPKYRDPVSGLTWSGHARPPAWIKDVPDRTVFLIDGKVGLSSMNKPVKRRGQHASSASAGSKTVGKVSRKRESVTA